ncbi:hypothetical protein BH10ACI1_BH10ACI1_33950 [soil metagenome]
MRFYVVAFVVILVCSSFIFSQDTIRAQGLEEIDSLNKQINALENEFLFPDFKDLEKAQENELSVFRILPREKYDGRLRVQGGGAFYSFSTKSHDYQKVAQICLEQNKLWTGFAGANYGFMTDLGEIPLLELNKESKGINFLFNYQPPIQLAKARIEQAKARNFEENGIIYENHLPIVVGHSYALRSISFDQADVLVIFNIERKEADGSLVVFWKFIETFATPILERN